MNSSISITASTGNIEKIGARQRHRGTTAEPQSRTIFTRREKRVQSQLNHQRIATQIGTKLLTDFGGEFEFDQLVELVDTMESMGVVNRRLVHDPAVRSAAIANVIYVMIEDGRLVGGHEMKGARRVGFVMLSPDERSIRMAQIKRQQSKQNRKKHERDRLRKEARANGQPVTLSRRERRRQKARNDARKLAATKKGRSTQKMPAHRAA